MKQTAIFTVIILVLLSGSSCTEEFLERNNNDWYSVSYPLQLDSFHEKAAISLQIPEKVNTVFTVCSRPVWLNAMTKKGKVTAGRLDLILVVDKKNLPDWNYNHNATVILEIEDFGFVTFEVIYTDYGSPSILCAPGVIILDGILSQSFSLSNPDKGILIWEMQDIPGWLTFSKTSGILSYGETEWITVNINEDVIPPATEMSAVVKITGNSSTGEFLLNVRVTASTIPLPGGFANGTILIDAEYHPESDMMAVCTKSPDQLLLLNMTKGSTDTIQLDRTPACISFSEDGTKAVLGYNVAVVSYIDIGAAEIAADFTIDCIPSDIVLGDNGWCYITPSEGGWQRIRNLCLGNGQLITSPSSMNIYGNTLIKKIPGKPYLAGSQLSLSPTGLMIIDISEGQANDTMTKYSAETKYIWPSKDGTRIFSAYGSIYILPEHDKQHHASPPPLYGTLKPENTYIYALDECASISSVFLCSRGYIALPSTSSSIEQYNTSTLSRIKTYKTKAEWLAVSGTVLLYETSPRFIFVKRDGTALYVLKTLRPDYKIDGWFLETIEL